MWGSQAVFKEFHWGSPEGSGRAERIGKPQRKRPASGSILDADWVGSGASEAQPGQAGDAWHFLRLKLERTRGAVSHKSDGMME